MKECASSYIFSRCLFTFIFFLHWLSVQEADFIEVSFQESHQATAAPEIRNSLGSISRGGKKTTCKGEWLEGSLHFTSVNIGAGYHVGERGTR